MKIPDFILEKIRQERVVKPGWYGSKETVFTSEEWRIRQGMGVDKEKGIIWHYVFAERNGEGYLLNASQYPKIQFIDHSGVILEEIVI